MSRLKLIFLSMALIVTSQTASATEPPGKKPQPTYKSSVLSRSDAEKLQLGLKAAREGDWTSVNGYRQAINDRAAQKLLFWRQASSSLNATDFNTLDRALKELEGWPGLYSLRVQAEEAIASSSLTPTSRVILLENSGPLSGEGKFALAEAYKALGRTDDANAMIRNAWRGHTFSISRQKELATKYASVLTPADHIQRADYLLWRDQRSAASAMKAYLDSSYDKLIDARIGLATGSAGVDGLVNAVPGSLQMSAGLLHDRSKWRRRKDRWEDARPLLLEINPVGLSDSALHDIWDEKNLHIRRAIRDKEYEVAYTLAATNGLTSGTDFAEGEFIAGWMALRYLNKPDVALTHFQTLEQGVTSPISLSRAQFWTGEALTALKRTAEAQAAYQRAAHHISYFYGQRAAERLGITNISLPAPVIPTEEQKTRFESMELVRVLRMLAEAGEDYQFRVISYHLDDTLETAADYKLLFELALDYNNTQAGVRAAKEGMSKDLVAAEAAYPLFPFKLPVDRSRSAEPALVIALSRQESELNAKAVSSARAYGLMQMLDGTASAQARREGKDYRRSWLVDDPEYNAELGRAHLSDLIDQFNGSYIMAIAAYNAGASRPKRWMTEYGDPRKGEIDPIDFIESIPFSETRNYVQRVLENTQVYRHRLAGQPVPIGLKDDLVRGH